jgi:uncharacterized membrane protein
MSHPARSAESVELLLAVFKAEDRAGVVLRELHHLEKEGKLRLFNSAVISKDSSGRAHLHETNDVDARRGTLFGGLVGGLIGLLGGPAGALVGAAAGAVAGGAIAGSVDLGFSNTFLAELQAELHAGSSALLVLVEQPWAEALVTHLAASGGHLMRHCLKADLAKRMAEEIQDQSA